MTEHTKKEAFPMKTIPTVTITSTNMGEPCTVADHVAWYAYFTAAIEEKCGFPVNTSLAPFGNGQEDAVAGASEYAREIIFQERDALWKEWCAGVRIEHMVRVPAGGAN
jgi:hypothetical protein